METKSTYVKKLVKTVVVAIIAGCIAYAMLDQDMMLAIACAGIPAGWRVLTKIFGRWIVVGNYMMFVYLAIKAVLAVLVGWIILPIDLIATIIKLVNAQKE